MKQAVKTLRAHPAVSNLLYAVARPIQDLARVVSARTARHVLRNGGSTTYDGVLLQFPPNVGIGFLSSISWHGVEGFEPETWLTLKHLIAASGTFLDIGANIGFYSVLARRIAPEVEVISFEPVPDVATRNRAFHEANGLAVNLHQVALSDADGQATLFKPDEDESTASTLAAESWQARKLHSEITVPTARLDTILADRPLRGPVTIKIDVEDHEAAVLRGAVETIRRYRPAIVCEILPRPKRPASRYGQQILALGEQHENTATLKVLSELDYTAFAITRDGYFRMTADDFKTDRGFRDFLLLPHTGADDLRHYYRNVADCAWLRSAAQAAEQTA